MLKSCIIKLKNEYKSIHLRFKKKVIEYLKTVNNQDKTAKIFHLHSNKKYMLEQQIEQILISKEYGADSAQDRLNTMFNRRRNVKSMLKKVDQIRTAISDSEYIIDTFDINIPDEEGCVVLHYAAFMGYREVVEWLLNEGAQLEATDKEGYTALYFAAQEGRDKVVQFLLSKGANVKAAQINGSTSLHIAADRGHTEVVKILLSEGADTEVINEDGHNPLHLAADRGHVEVVEWLLSQGAQLKATEKEGYTALHIAAQNGQLGVVEFLLSKGVDANIEAANMLTPLHLAAGERSFEIVECLLDNGANVNATCQKKRQDSSTLCCMPTRLYKNRKVFIE